MSKIKFGIIGTGNVADIHARVIKEIENAELAAVADSNTEKGRSFADKYGCNFFESYNEMFLKEDVSVVSICTPATTHANIALDAVDSGKHVIIEKPIDVDLAAIDRLIHAAERKGVKICTIFQHRFDDAVIKAKKAVDEGRLGRLYFGACHTKWYRDQKYYRSGFGRGTWAFDGGGALMNQSIHYIDLLLYLLGDASEVYGSCGVYTHTDIEVEDLGVATVKFKNGGVGIIEGTTAAYPGLYAKLDIYGEKGTLSIQDDALVWYNVMDMKPEEEAYMLRKREQKVGASDPLAFPVDSHKRQYLNMLDAIENVTEPLVNGKEGRKSVELVLSIYKSWKTGQPVRLGWCLI